MDELGYFAVHNNKGGVQRNPDSEAWKDEEDAEAKSTLKTQGRQSPEGKGVTTGGEREREREGSLGGISALITPSFGLR
jgi:hypothetical protein